MMQQSEGKPAKVWLRELADRCYQEGWDAKRRGEMVGWATSNFPQEIPSSMGISVVYPENQAAAIAAKGGGQRMCEHAEASGYANDICAYARINLAFADMKACEELDMPQPDFLLCCNNICNCVIKWYENLAYELNIPLILIDIPFNNDIGVSADRVSYVRAQFEDACRRLSEITGKPFSEDRLRETMRTSVRTAKAWRRATDCSTYVPSPFSGFDLFNHMAVAVCGRGKPEAAAAFELLADEYEALARQGQSSFRGEEKYRILFEGIACFPHLKHTFVTLRDAGINVVATMYAETFGYLYGSLDELCAAYCDIPNSTSLERSVRMRVNAGRKTGVDGVLVHTNRSCKLWSGFMPEMARRIQAELGVPTIAFDGDQADPRNFSSAQYDMRVQGLVDVMEEAGRRKPK